MECIGAVVLVDIIVVAAPQDQEDASLVADAEILDGEDHQARSILTRLLATGAGCVAIWPVTVPKPVMHSHREVAILALPVEDSHNPGKEAHKEDVAVVGKSGSVPLMCCMMGTGMNIPWTMQVNCTSHWTLDRLLPRRLKRKMIKT